LGHHEGAEGVLEQYGAQPGAGRLPTLRPARRLVEKGVRFVQLFDWGWDFHGTAPRGHQTGLPKRARRWTSRHGPHPRPEGTRVLDETLVIWTGEFGRTPFREGRTRGERPAGRDHHPHCYSMFMAAQDETRH